VSRWRRSKAEVQKNLHLAEPPDDAFMDLLETAGEDDFVDGPPPGPNARHYTPAEIEGIIAGASAGKLLAQARRESGRSLAEVGEAAGVSRARVQQIERSENIEVATLVRIAAACGYEVDITLRPRDEPGKRTIATKLSA
jgi:DNA-binding XRE family transcriptional regulator